MMRPKLLQITTLLILIFVLATCNSKPESTPTTTVTKETVNEVSPTAASTTAPIPTPNLVVDIATGEPVSAEPTAEPTAAPEANTLPIVIGSKVNTEQQILGTLMVELLSANGFDVVDQIGYGSTTLVREAIEAGEIDVYPEYNGTGLSLIQGIPSSALPDDSQRTYELAKTLDQPNGLLWLDMADFNSAFTLLVRDTLLEQDVTSIEDLKTFIDNSEATIKFCIELDFYTRPTGGLRDLFSLYDLQIPDANIVITSLDGAYSSLRSGECDVAEGLATDARIDAWGFTRLGDPRNFFPFNNPAPVMRAETAEIYPGAVDLLNNLFRTLNNDIISNLSSQVDLGIDGEFDTGDERTRREVALAYLSRIGLLGEQPKISIGTLDVGRMRLVAAITAQLLNNNGFDTQVITYSSTEDLRVALLNGEVDLSWDSTARTLLTIHNLPLSSLPKDGRSTYSMVKALDERHADLVWLSPLNWDSNVVASMQPGADYEQMENVSKMFASFANGTAADKTICVIPTMVDRILSNLEQKLGFEFTEEQLNVSELDVILENLHAGECDIGLAMNTDPRLAAYGFVTLPDPNHIFPSTSDAPAVRTDIAKQLPEIETLLDQALSSLTVDLVTTMLARISYGADGVNGSGDEETMDDVVASFLTQSGVTGDLPTITVGAQPFTEQTILAALTSIVLQDLGFNVVDRTDLANTEAAYTEISQETIDIFWSYTGNTLRDIHILDEIPSDTAEAFTLAQELDSPIGLTWLGSSAFNDTFALIVDPSTLPTPLDSISDLATYMNAEDAPLVLCTDEDFVARGDGLLALQERYEFAFNAENITIVVVDALYATQEQGECDVVAGFRTDGHIAAFGLQALTDDLSFFPASNAAPLIRADMATTYPAIGTALNTLAQSLSDANMATLNARVSIGNESVASVSQQYLCQNELVTVGCENVASVVEDSAESTQTCEIADINGSFEEDRIWRTPLTRSAGEYSNVHAHSGNWAMQLGARGRGVLESYSIAQTLLTIPQDIDSAHISFWYYPTSLDVLGGDQASLHIFDESLSLIRNIFSYPVTGEEAWSQVNFDISAFRGDTIMLHFLVINDGDGIPTTTFIDDVELQYCKDKSGG